VISLNKIKDLIDRIFDPLGAFFRAIIDFFYPPFSRYFSKQFFRYGATGCFNLAFDWTLYFLIYNLILHHHLVDLGFIVVSSHIAALGFKFPITLITGFLMQKYVTFSNSALRGRVQLFRYLIVFFINLTINYIGLKILVDHFEWYPTPSNMIISIITIIISYFSQKYFTFRITPESQES